MKDISVSSGLSMDMVSSAWTLVLGLLSAGTGTLVSAEADLPSLLLTGEDNTVAGLLFSGEGEVSSFFFLYRPDPGLSLDTLSLPPKLDFFIRFSTELVYL